MFCAPELNSHCVEPFFDVASTVVSVLICSHDMDDDHGCVGVWVCGRFDVLSLDCSLQ